MKIQVVEDGMGLDLKMTGAPQELSRAVDFLKVMIPKRRRSYDDSSQTWRIEKRAEKKFNAWLGEMHGPNLFIQRRRVVRETVTLEQMASGQTRKQRRAA